MTDSDVLTPMGDPPSGAYAITRSHPALRTIGALILREMSTRFGRQPGGYIWAILQPLGVIILLSFAFSLLSRTPALGVSFILFKATGIMIFQLFSTPVQLVSKSLSYSRALLSYPGVVWIDTLIARYVLNTVVTVIVTIIILTGTIMFEGLSLILDWGMILKAIALTALLSLGVGVFNSFMSERFDVYSNLWRILTAPLMIASGILMLYDDLPQLAQEVLWYNPLIHTVGMMRAGFYSTYDPQYISVSLVLLYALIPLVLGLIFLRRHHRELLTR